MFPDTNTNWQAFFEVQKLILKNAGKVYASQASMPRTHSRLRSSAVPSSAVLFIAFQ